MPDLGSLRAYLWPHWRLWPRCILSLQLFQLSPLLFPSWGCFCHSHSVKAQTNKTHPCNGWTDRSILLCQQCFIRNGQKVIVPALFCASSHCLNRHNVLHAVEQVGTAQETSTACESLSSSVGHSSRFFFCFVLCCGFNFFICLNVWIRLRKPTKANISNATRLKDTDLQSRCPSPSVLLSQGGLLVNVLVVPYIGFPPFKNGPSCHL